ncbi:MAG TPA: hypothetical protein VMU83_21845 [Hanamia sp.]|nr:hypothetical protein [Hanamia sp.]
MKSKLLLIDSLNKGFPVYGKDSVFEDAGNYFFHAGNRNNIIYILNDNQSILKYKYYNSNAYTKINALCESYSGNLLLVGWSYVRNTETGKLYQVTTLTEFRKFGTPSNN